MRKTWLVFSQAVTVAVAVLFVVATLKPEWVQRAAPLPSVVATTSSPAQVLPTSLAGGGQHHRQQGAGGPGAQR